MSTTRAPAQAVGGAEGLRVGIVAARGHDEVMQGLVEGALQALRQAGAPDPAVMRVPGAFDLPVVAARMAEVGYDAVVCLGVLVRGATPHFDYVCQAATLGCSEVAVRTGVPVGFGVLICDHEHQARDRAGLEGSRENKGYEAAQSAVATALVVRGLVRPADA